MMWKNVYLFSAGVKKKWQIFVYYKKHTPQAMTKKTGVKTGGANILLSWQYGRKGGGNINKKRVKF